MDVFSLRESLVDQYASFARSFTQIRAPGIREQVTAAYDSGRFWPDPLIQINPRYKKGRRVAELAAAGTLHPKCVDLFDIELYQHQEYAAELAAKGESYVVTTGTGSGKSLCFFIPIVDAVLKAKAADATPRTRAIVIYPMNALANSQQEELKKFLGENGPVTYARYTGQESTEDRERIRDNPPDILLTKLHDAGAADDSAGGSRSGGDPQLPGSAIPRAGRVAHLSLPAGSRRSYACTAGAGATRR